MKRAISIICCLLPSLFAQAHNGDIWSEYQRLAKITAIQTEQLSLDKINTNAGQLVNKAKQMLELFIDKNKHCEPYLKAVLAAADKMPSLSLERIEVDYHADGKLPVTPDSSCYHAKDLLVHAATVAVLAKTQADNETTREKIKYELLEVLSHFTQVKSKV